jgi:O-phosphoseryl-tRNA(Cys) synthetase
VGDFVGRTVGVRDGEYVGDLVGPAVTKEVVINVGTILGAEVLV